MTANTKVTHEDPNNVNLVYDLIHEMAADGYVWGTQLSISGRGVQVWRKYPNVTELELELLPYRIGNVDVTPDIGAVVAAQNEKGNELLPVFGGVGFVEGEGEDAVATSYYFLYFGKRTGETQTVSIEDVTGLSQLGRLLISNGD